MLITAKVENNRIRVRAPLLMNGKCGAIPGATFSKKESCWEYPASPTAALAILKEFRLVLRVDAEFNALVRASQLIVSAEKIKTATDLPPIPVTKTEPWQHQLRGYHYAYGMPACLLALDMGTGKSKVVVDLIQNRDHKRVLIMAPLSVIQEWPRQFETHCAVPHVLARLDGKSDSVARKTEKAAECLRQAKEAGTTGIVAINYESAWREPFGPIISARNNRVLHPGFALSAGFDLVVCDESQRIQAHNSQVSKFCGKLGEKTPYRLCLSGTPLSANPLSAFGQYRFLDPGIFGTSFTKFRSQYAIMGGFQNKQIVGWQNEAELQRKFYSIAYRVESRDVLDLPEEQHIELCCQLSGRAMKAYSELENEFYTVVDNLTTAYFEGIEDAAASGEASVANALVKLLRLQQITSGHLPLDDGTTVPIDTAKEDTLHERLTDLPPAEPVVVFCRFRHDLEAIRRVAGRLERQYFELSGSARQLEEWRAAGTGIIGVQIQAGGLGVDMTQARYCFYYSVGYSLGEFKQSLARVMRPGQHRSVIYYHIVAEGTVDQKVYQALAAKESVVNTILKRAA
jgi:SNF2 family DNA or RNA helicase